MNFWSIGVESIKQAEIALKSFSKDPNCINAFVNQITSNPDEACRLQAALQLKKYISKHYKKFTREQQSTVKVGLLNLATNDPINAVRTAIAGSIAMLAKTVFNQEKNWPEVFSLMMQLAQDPDDSKRAMTYNLAGISIHSFIHLSIHPYIQTSIHPSIHPSIHTSIHPSIHTYTHT